jgi:O-antigen ligase
MNNKFCISKQKINAFLFAVLLTVSQINSLITSVLPISFGLVIPIILMLYFISLVVNHSFKFSILVFMVYLVLLTLLFYTSLNFSITNTVVDYFTNFLLVFTISWYVLACKINVKSLFNYVNIVSLICSPISIMMVLSSYGDPELRLGVSYSLLPAYLVVITMFIEKNTLVTKIIALINIITWGYFYFYFGNRGVILCIALYVVAYLIWMNKMKISNKVFLGFLCVPIVTYIISNFQTLLVSLNTFLTSNGIYIFFIQKTVYFLTRGDLGNGRGNLYSDALNQILLRPILGNGIGTFEEQFGLYTHNLVLQILVEGGVLYFFLFVLVMVVFVIELLSKSVQYDEKKLLLILAFAGVIPLMFSKVYWTTNCFWLFISFLLYLYEKKRIMGND